MVTPVATSAYCRSLASAALPSRAGTPRTAVMLRLSPITTWVGGTGLVRLGMNGIKAWPGIANPATGAALARE
jgi:hypothetical protein